MSTRIEINVQTSEQVVLELTAEELAQKAAEIAAQAAKQAAKPYFEKRAAEYPSMTDYLDGVVKGDQAQIDKYIADCLAIKAKYPKG
jgi:predicted GTPase